MQYKYRENYIELNDGLLIYSLSVEAKQIFTDIVVNFNKDILMK